jgi:transposase
MPCPVPKYRPAFSSDELDRARDVVRRRNAPHSMVQRAKLALLLADDPAMTCAEAGRRLDLHPNTPRTWRRRWTTEGFSLEDRARSGRPREFSPRRDRPDQGRRLRVAGAA